jgi:uncharacterized membrane protein
MQERRLLRPILRRKYKMEHLELISVPLIVGVVFAVMAAFKKGFGEGSKVLKFLPLIALGLGVVLGVIAFYAAPGIIPASNVFMAILIGGASGLAATGTHQIYKQLTAKTDPTAPQADAPQEESAETEPQTEPQEPPSDASETESDDDAAKLPLDMP